MPDDDCLHCALNRTVDDFAERYHRTIGKPLDADRVVDDLVACAAEIIAAIDDTRERRRVAREMGKLLTARVTHFRAINHYPGAPGQRGGPPLH
jgi:hypothetical protein